MNLWGTASGFCAAVLALTACAGGSSSVVTVIATPPSTPSATTSEAPTERSSPATPSVSMPTTPQSTESPETTQTIESIAAACTVLRDTVKTLRETAGEDAEADTAIYQGLAVELGGMLDALEPSQREALEGVVDVARERGDVGPKPEDPSAAFDWVLANLDLVIDFYRVLDEAAPTCAEAGVRLPSD